MFQRGDGQNALFRGRARRETVPDTVSSQMLANDLAKFTLE